MREGQSKRKSQREGRDRWLVKRENEETEGKGMMEESKKEKT